MGLQSTFAFIKEAILLNAKVDCNPIIIADKPNPKSMGRTISCLLPEDKLEQLQSWARNNNAKKLALFTESLPFWTSKTSSLFTREKLSKKSEEINEVTDVPEGAQGAFATTESEVADSTPAEVSNSTSEEPSKNNEEDIAEVTDTPEGAQSNFATTEMGTSVPTPVVDPILIPKELKNNSEETDEVTDFVEVPDAPKGAQGTKKTSDESLEATDDPEGAQGTTTIDTDAEVTKVAKATKVAKVIKVIKAKSARKKGAYQTSPGSSIAKNRPKRACTLKRTTLGQPMVVASRKVSRNSSASQKRMSDYFPKK